jgi:hypothetical protein
VRSSTAESEFGKGVLHVRPSAHGRVPSWLGLPGVLSNALCQAIMGVLLHERSGSRVISRCDAKTSHSRQRGTRSVPLPILNWDHVAASAARNIARGMLSKFQPCLPADAENRLLAERLVDQSGTLRFLTAMKVNGMRLTSRPTDMKLPGIDATGPLPDGE